MASNIGPSPPTDPFILLILSVRQELGLMLAIIDLAGKLYTLPPKGHLKG